MIHGNFILLVLVIFTAVLGKKISHTGGFFSRVGWDVKDFFWGYEVSLLIVVLLSINLPIELEKIEFPKFSLSYKYFHKLLAFEGIGRLSFLLFSVAMTIYQYSISQRLILSKTNNFKKIFELVTFNGLSIFLYFLLGEKPLMSKETSLLALFLAFRIIYELYWNRKRLRLTKKLKDY